MQCHAGSYTFSRMYVRTLGRGRVQRQCKVQRSGHPAAVAVATKILVSDLHVLIAATLPAAVPAGPTCRTLMYTFFASLVLPAHHHRRHYGHRNDDMQAHLHVHVSVRSHIIMHAHARARHITSGVVGYNIYIYVGGVYDEETVGAITYTRVRVRVIRSAGGRCQVLMLCQIYITPHTSDTAHIYVRVQDRCPYLTMYMHIRIYTCVQHITYHMPLMPTASVPMMHTTGILIVPRRTVDYCEHQHSNQQYDVVL